MAEPKPVLIHKGYAVYRSGTFRFEIHTVGGKYITDKPTKGAARRWINGRVKGKK